jgi:hypothetical protein
MNPNNNTEPVQENVHLNEEQDRILRRLTADLREIPSVIPDDSVLDPIKSLGMRLIEAVDTLKLIRDHPDTFAPRAPAKRKRNRRRKKVSLCK